MTDNSLNHFRFTGYVVKNGVLRESSDRSKKWLEFTIAVKSKHKRNANFIPIIMTTDIEIYYNLARLGHLITISGEVISKETFNALNGQELSKITFIAYEFMFIRKSSKVVSQYEKQYKAISRATSVDDFPAQRLFRKSPKLNAVTAKGEKK